MRLSRLRIEDSQGLCPPRRRRQKSLSRHQPNLSQANRTRVPNREFRAPSIKRRTKNLEIQHQARALRNQANQPTGLQRMTQPNHKPNRGILGTRRNQSCRGRTRPLRPMADQITPRNRPALRTNKLLQNRHRRLTCRLTGPQPNLPQATPLRRSLQRENRIQRRNPATRNQTPTTNSPKAAMRQSQP